MTRFKASVQYQDFDGTAAADRADGNYTLDHFLESKGLMKDGEFLLAATTWIGENHAGKLGSVHISAHLFENGSFDNAKVALASTQDPIPVRTINIAVSLEEYIGFFKRFEVILTRHGLGLEGREFVST